MKKKYIYIMYKNKNSRKKNIKFFKKSRKKYKRKGLKYGGAEIPPNNNSVNRNTVNRNTVNKNTVNLVNE